MNLPSIILGCLFATLYGALFHLWRGGSFFRLLLYILFGWIGFWIFNFLAGFWGWTFLSIGSLRLGAASLGSLFVIGFGGWLSMVK
ncbi:MAG TPA: hypothetical protein VMC62_05175, partial [Longilinea sp.]|nr:hypothetical protein [Longilinea sp.]